jgi:hypothetical protein
MTPRTGAVVWLAALALAAALLAALAATPPLRDIPRLPEGTGIVVIGSSLTTYGIPLDPVPGGLLGDGRAHARWSTGAITEARTLELVEGALAQGARMLLVEANAFAVRPHGDRDPAPADLAGRVEAGLARLHGRIEAGLMARAGEAPLPVAMRDPKLDPRPWFPERLDLAARFPLVLSQPEDPARLDRALAEAQAKGVEVVLYEPPRPASTRAAMGPEGHAAYLAHLSAFAKARGLPLMTFGTDWPDSLFRDDMHPDRTGRARLVAELAAAYGALAP